MVWIRITGIALLIAGVLSLLLIPGFGAHVAIVSAASIAVGATALAIGNRRKHSPDGEWASGGVYGDASGLDVPTDHRDHHHHATHGSHAGHDGGFDGGHGGDGGGGDSGSH